MKAILLPGNSLKFPLVKVIVSKIAYKSLITTKNSHFLRTDHRNVVHEIFFRGGGGHLEKCSISSPIRVQIAQELVRLITLIGLNKFLMHIISPKSLKKFSWTTFRWSVLRKCEFLVVLRLL